MPDLIQIKSLKVKTKIGVYAWEQQIEQTLLLDIDITTDFSQYKDTENILDYAKICSLITQYVETNIFKLIETVAKKVALLIKEQLVCEEIKVKVIKPYCIKNAAEVSVTVVLP